MDIRTYLGETTEYDKKQEVERRKVKSWLKSVSAFANGVGGCLLFGIVDNKGILTYAGLLMADECPLRQSRVFCTRWNGKTRAGGSVDALDSAEITGGLVTLLEDTMSFIRRNTRTMWYKEPMQRVEIPEYMERSVLEAVVNALAHRDYLILGSEVHVDMYDDRMAIYSPGGMPEGRLIQDMDLSDIPSVRRNPVVADIFTQLGFMERKGSGMGKILNPIKNLPYFTERLLPKFFSDRAQFTITFPNMIGIWLETHPGMEVNWVESTDDTQGVTQGVTQSVTQSVTQGVTQGKELDKWIERQVATYPKITTKELASQVGVTTRTIKRHITNMPHIVYVGSGYSGHWEVRKKD